MEPVRKLFGVNGRTRLVRFGEPINDGLKYKRLHRHASLLSSFPE
jgi:hypothetical protein